RRDRHRKSCRFWKARLGFSLRSRGKVWAVVLRGVGVTVQGECELAISIGALRVVFERPVIFGAFAFQRGRSECSWHIRRDEGAARFIGARDKTHGKACPFTLAIKVEPEGADRSSARAGLCRVEETEKETGAGLRIGECEAARCGKLIVERERRCERSGIARRGG